MNIGLLLVLAGGVVLTIGDIFMKEWVLKNENWLFIVGLIIYIIGLILLSFSFKYKNIAVASMIFVIFNIVTLLLASWLFFKDSLTYQQIIGIILGISSIVFLES